MRDPHEKARWQVANRAFFNAACAPCACMFSTDQYGKVWW
ncbi:uncharacterized protein BCN122_I1269 [Burkholderia cenocepacia]|nr:uncharacterized protein BCN122_I1269 [Burkholderia cenocepacia]